MKHETLIIHPFIISLYSLKHFYSAFYTHIAWLLVFSFVYIRFKFAIIKNIVIIL